MTGVQTCALPIYPLFKKVLDSQRAYAERTTQWWNDYTVDFKMAANHYFGKKAAKA